MSPRTRVVIRVTLAASILSLVGLRAQGLSSAPSSHVPRASNVIVPQARAFPVDRQAAVEITDVTVGVVILEQVATTTMEIGLANPTGSMLESELIVPVPAGAVVRGFTFQGAAKEATAEVLPKEDARRTYDAIVAKIRDPALLEFIGYHLIRSSVFPVPPKGDQKVRLTYEAIVAADGDRVDYVLPRSESIDYRVPWKMTARVESKQPISTVYSPSHRLELVRSSPHVVTARVVSGSTTEPGQFRLSYLVERGGVNASLFAYPDPKVGGGYFLLLAGLPATAAPAAGESPMKRELTLVIDRSGSMNGEKLEQVREAACQILAGLRDGEAFNILVYSQTVEMFAKSPVLKSGETARAATGYLGAVTARGGTNLHDALVEALRQPPTRDMLPVVLFLTDGLPTIGQTSESAIRDVALKGNPHQRRVFAIGVGVDVNTPLLERISDETRATATFILPKEDVEVKVARVFERLSGPVLASPELDVTRQDGSPDPGRVLDLIPSRLPDLFEGDQLVLAGRYVGESPLGFSVSGNYLGRKRSFRFAFDLNRATTRNAFVSRLWASRKIATLIDAIRQIGGDTAPAVAAREPRAHPGGTVASISDPKIRELVGEIVRLSTEFGILTEYTSFLAREGVDLSQRDQVLLEAERSFRGRAIGVRSGIASVNQEFNSQFQKQQDVTNFRNSFWDENMNRVAIANVQQVSDLAFYQRGGRWIDSRVVQKESETRPRKVIEFGSTEFCDLAYRLAEQGRQGSIALKGDILMVVDGEPVLVKGPPPTVPAGDPSATTERNTGKP